MRYDDLFDTSLPKKVYTLKEAADLLGVSESTAERYIKSNKIIGFKIGKYYYINKDYLDNLIEMEED